MRASVAACLLTVLALGCEKGACSTTTTTKPNPIQTAYFPIPLGNGRNYLHVVKQLYLGPRVERFRLKVRFKWIPGATVMLVNTDTGKLQTLTASPPSAERDGAFFSDEFKGNRIELRILSKDVLDFGGGKPAFEILEVERHFRADRTASFVPPPVEPSTDWGAQPLGPGDEQIGIIPDVGGTSYYYIEPQPLMHPVALYISPRLVAEANRVHLRVAISHTTFFATDDPHAPWVEPVPGDTGIYQELIPPAARPIYVSVATVLPTPFLISHVPHVSAREIYLERPEELTVAPPVDVATLLARRDEAGPYDPQLGGFIQVNATYDRRIREVVAIGSARLLEFTNGHIRFGDATLMQNSSFFRDVDVHISICDPPCRANSWVARVLLWDTNLVDPIAGSKSLVHEWGHYDFGLPDEYDEDPPPGSPVTVDGNCLMGTHESPKACMPKNHVWSDGAGDEEACWIEMHDQFPELQPDPAIATWWRLGRYFDVVNKLDQLLHFTIPTQPSRGPGREGPRTL